MERHEFIGATLLIAGVILFGFVHLAIANYIPDMTGWSDPPGKFNQVLSDIMIGIPYYLSIVFMVVGILLLFWKNLKKSYRYLYVDEK